MAPAKGHPPDTLQDSNDDPSDHSLLRRFSLGSQDAATQLYLRYAQRLRSLVAAECSHDLAHLVDVEDIVQSVFGSFFRRARQGLYDVPPGEELWRLLLVIALNKIRSKGAFHRAAKRDVRRTTAGEEAERHLAASGSLAAEYAFLELTIDDALLRLPPDHHTMTELRIRGYEVAEIAQQTGRAKRTVERILQEARQFLQVLLRKED
jgi:RNA polymerase sigma-70 factor (ECF subfamily)